MKRLGFWSLFAATMTLYAVIVFWSLPHIAAQANGLIAFDLRPSGYTFDEAIEVLSTLSATGVAFYLGTQHMLDTVYPPLMSLTLLFAIAAMTKPIGKGRWILASFAIPSALFDIGENLAVGRLLKAGPSLVTPEMVAEASWYTVMKSVSTTLAMSILVVVLVARGAAFVRKKAWQRPRVQPV